LQNATPFFDLPWSQCCKKRHSNAAKNDTRLLQNAAEGRPDKGLMLQNAAMRCKMRQSPQRL
jgi:hypothetical protein